MPPTDNSGSSKIVHPTYALLQPTWQKALDVYEGLGGFLDEDRPYLYAHPREWLDHSITSSDGKGTVPNPNPRQASPKLKMRRRLARYENISATILDTIVGSLFHEMPKRTFGKPTADDHPVRQWWGNVDGKGTTADAFMIDSWLTGAVFGHALLMLDKSTQEAETAADVQLPRLYKYTPIDLIDWLLDETGKLTAVKLLEAEPRESLGKPARLNQMRVRVIDEKQWTLYDSSGKKIDQADHGFNRLPVVVLYGKRRPLTPLIGKSVIGDPALFIDVYNLTSEVRELLRNQTFAILNVPLGKDGDVEVEQSRMGQQTGTANVLFSGEKADYISPPGDNVAAYHEHLDRLGRMIYRLAAVPWDGDSKDAESADSRQIKRADMNASLLKFAGELERADNEVLELVYRALHGEQWETQMEADEVSVAYSTTFEPPDLEKTAAQAADLIGLDLGETFAKELKKRAAREALPGLTDEQVKKIDEEIEAIKVKTADEKQQELLDASMKKLSAVPPKAPKLPAA